MKKKRFNFYEETRSAGERQIFPLDSWLPNSSLVFLRGEKEVTVTFPVRRISRSVPFFLRDSSLTQDFTKKRDSYVTPMRVWDTHRKALLLHEGMFASAKRAIESKMAKPTDEFTARNRFKHGQNGVGGLFDDGQRRGQACRLLVLKATTPQGFLLVSRGIAQEPLRWPKRQDILEFHRNKFCPRGVYNEPALMPLEHIRLAFLVSNNVKKLSQLVEKDKDEDRRRG